MLETALKIDNTFCTLTYRPEAIPLSGSGLPTLDPKHLQDWLKRLRWSWRDFTSPLENTDARILRFYAVGEYGDETFRPHYHVALFGYPTCSRLTLPVTRSGCPCHSCSMVRTTWGLGHVHLGTLEPASARYLAGYIEKKMTRTDDPRLGDRHPEFSRMSRRPGIGADMMDEVASTLLQFNLEDATQGDVPSSLRHGTRTMPLGRYLRRRLRTRLGKEANAPQEAISTLNETMRPMLEAAFDAAKRDKKNPSIRHHLVEGNTAKALSQAARSKIRKQRKPL